jgi:hypothetical protein
MNKLEIYSAFALAFIVNAIIVSSIGTISVETRLAIDQIPDEPKIYKWGISEIFQNIFDILRFLPYQFADKFGFLNKKGKIPEWIKAGYTFLITFVIALLVYHVFLFILGYKQLYKYFFGNLTVALHPNKAPWKISKHK